MGQDLPDADAGLPTPVRVRLAFEELLAHQLSLRLLRDDIRSEPAWPLPTAQTLNARFRAALPFTPTAAQERALAEILADLAKPSPMLRLVQGDVGSGKTLVALLTMLNVVASGTQTALMAPTDLLSAQHYQFFCNALENTSIKVDLLTGKTSPKQQLQLKKDLAEGNIDILIGTHALFQKGVEFKDLGYIIIDEMNSQDIDNEIDWEIAEIKYSLLKK